jgi:hypothetical protein
MTGCSIGVQGIRLLRIGVTSEHITIEFNLHIFAIPETTALEATGVREALDLGLKIINPDISSGFMKYPPCGLRRARKSVLAQDYSFGATKG